MLDVGIKAPDFTLPDKDGKNISLSDFIGKKIILYFYPKDNTPGCTKQACAFAANFEKFKEIDYLLKAVAGDGVIPIKFEETYRIFRKAVGYRD